MSDTFCAECDTRLVGEYVAVWHMGVSFCDEDCQDAYFDQLQSPYYGGN